MTDKQKMEIVWIQNLKALVEHGMFRDDPRWKKIFIEKLDETNAVLQSDKQEQDTAGGPRKTYSFIGNDCPPGYRRVGTIDVADPADVHSAQDRGYRIGTIYDGYSGSCAEPCAADIYERPDDELSPEEQSLAEAIGLGIGGRGVAEY